MAEIREVTLQILAPVRFELAIIWFLGKNTTMRDIKILSQIKFITSVINPAQNLFEVELSQAS